MKFFFKVIFGLFIIGTLLSVFLGVLGIVTGTAIGIIGIFANIIGAVVSIVFNIVGTVFGIIFKIAFSQVVWIILLIYLFNKYRKRSHG